MMERKYVVPLRADWPVHTTDLLVVGSGIAGLFTAIKAASYGRITVLTKKSVRDCNTGLAQGGIAAAVHEEDSPFLHLEDTLEAGDGLCDVAAVQVLVEEGPARVFELMAMGARFDMKDGSIDLHREGAHSKPRILHAADATGEAIRQSLIDRCAREQNIEILEDHTVVDLITAGNECLGAVIWDSAESRFMLVKARAVVLATGGCGQLYKFTTNPDIATGDGIVCGFRAGCNVADMEFVQFHPTVLALPTRQRFLISEACRGAGGVLFNNRGVRFMQGVHPMMELAPRDVVARAIWREMQESGQDHVFLDLTGIPGVADRFPNIFRHCLENGIDIRRDRLPVAPAAHYMMGGIKTDLYGYTGVRRLYACGETASTGVHGANRLASNSLLEGIVFGHKIVEDVPRWIKDEPEADILDVCLAEENCFEEPPRGTMAPEDIVSRLQDVMWDKAGIIRDEQGLTEAISEISSLRADLSYEPANLAYYQTANLLLLGEMVARAALWRKESRGAHYRSDYPARDDRSWRYHVVFNNMNWKKHAR